MKRWILVVCAFGIGLLAMYGIATSGGGRHGDDLPSVSSAHEIDPVSREKLLQVLREERANDGRREAR